MSFFDAPWHIVLLLLAALILFGSSRLPGAAKALGSSMNIFKKSLKEGADHSGEPGPGAQATSHQTYTPPAPPQLSSGPSAPSQQAQIDALQRQLNDLQRQEAAPADTPQPRSS